MNLTFSHFSCASGGTMRWAKSPTPDHARGIILILPGWGEWIEKYSQTISALVQRRYEVLIIEWRGQGLSSRFLANRHKTWIESFDLLVKDLEDFYRQNLASLKQPIIVLGHSMGAHLALRWLLGAGRGHLNIDKVILLSIMQEIKTPPFPLWLAQMIVMVACACGLGQSFAIGQESFDQAAIPFDDNVLTHDPARYRSMIMQLRENSGMKVGGVTFGWLNALFASCRALDTALAQGAPKRRHLVVCPAHDPLVNTKAMQNIASLLPYSTAPVIAYAHHELLQENDAVQAQLWTLIDHFLNEKETA